MVIFPGVTEKNTLKTGTPRAVYCIPIHGSGSTRHSTAEIRIVQDCAAMSAMAEFLLPSVTNRIYDDIATLVRISSEIAKRAICKIACDRSLSRLAPQTSEIR